MDYCTVYFMQFIDRGLALMVTGVLGMEWQKSFAANYRTMVDNLNASELIPHFISDDLLTMKEKGEVECQVQKMNNY